MSKVRRSFLWEKISTFSDFFMCHEFLPGLPKYLQEKKSKNVFEVANYFSIFFVTETLKLLEFETQAF